MCACGLETRTLSWGFCSKREYSADNKEILSISVVSLVQIQCQFCFTICSPPPPPPPPKLASASKSVWPGLKTAIHLALEISCDQVLYVWKKALVFFSASHKLYFLAYNMGLQVWLEVPESSWNFSKDWTFLMLSKSDFLNKKVVWWKNFQNDRYNTWISTIP